MLSSLAFSSWPGLAVRRTASLPLAYARPSTSFLLLYTKTWMPGTRPGMTKARASALILRPQPISDSGFGQNELRTLRVGFDLLPELSHIDPQILRVGHFVPQFLQEKAVGQHLAGMLHQHAQQFVFLWRELDVLLADLDDAAHQVDGEVAGSKHRPLAMDLQLMAQRRAHAGKQLVHSERFCQVIVGAEIERLDLARLVAAARQHDDRNAVIAAADHAQQIMALDIRQAEIENDQRRILRQQL